MCFYLLTCANRPNLICIENPLQPEVDMGKNSYNMPKIRRSFELAYQVLISVSHRSSTDESILAYIINPSDSLFFGRKVSPYPENNAATPGKKRRKKSKLEV